MGTDEWLAQVADLVCAPFDLYRRRQSELDFPFSARTTESQEGQLALCPCFSEITTRLVSTTF
jgi:hypothetical protein